MTGGNVRQYPYFVRLFQTSTPLRSVELSKERQRVHDWGKVRQYLYFVRLFQTSTPLRSVVLRKKWRNSGFHGQGWHDVLLRGGGKAGEGGGGGGREGGGVKSKALTKLWRCGAELKITPGQQKVYGQNDHYLHDTGNYKNGPAAIGLSCFGIPADPLF